MLCQLEHPNIISFVGVSLKPLCFALELAPLGSLQSILEQGREEQYQENNVDETKLESYNLSTVLERTMTYRIALQVSYSSLLSFASKVFKAPELARVYKIFVVDPLKATNADLKICLFVRVHKKTMP